MSLSYYLTRANVVGTASLGGQTTITGDHDIRYSDSLGVVTNQVISISFDKTKLLVAMLTSDQDMTVYMNGHTSPLFTVPLKANVPYLYSSDGYVTSPFTSNITTIEVTTTVATTFNMVFLLSA
jgi:hypothetical protein